MNASADYLVTRVVLVFSLYMCRRVLQKARDSSKGEFCPKGICSTWMQCYWLLQAVPMTIPFCSAFYSFMCVVFVAVGDFILQQKSVDKLSNLCEQL